MRLIESSVEIIEQPEGLKGMYQQIEKAARTCYKSEANITEDSAEKMVKRLIDSKHYAMLEHGTVYLRYYHAVYENSNLTEFFRNNPYSRVTTIYMGDSVPTVGDFITTNWRVIVENNLRDRILGFMCEPTEHHKKRVTAKFICDRAVSHQLVRSRSMSFAQESQRYCNYSKNQYDSTVTFIMPSWFPEGTLQQQEIFMNTCHRCEQAYLMQLELELKPQDARAVLPNATKTEVVMTGFISDWVNFFKLRSAKAETGKPHPDMQILADKLLQEFIKRSYIEEL